MLSGWETVPDVCRRLLCGPVSTVLGGHRAVLRSCPSSLAVRPPTKVASFLASGVGILDAPRNGDVRVDAPDFYKEPVGGPSLPAPYTCPGAEF